MGKIIKANEGYIVLDRLMAKIQQNNYQATQQMLDETWAEWEQKAEEVKENEYTVGINLEGLSRAGTERFVVTVPEDVDRLDIAMALEDGHTYLLDKNNENSYEKLGKTPQTLLNYVCENKKWKWELLMCDIEINF